MALDLYENFLCPYCSQTNNLAIDITGGADQTLLVDCEVCCAPIITHVQLDGDRILSLDARKEND